MPAADAAFLPGRTARPAHDIVLATLNARWTHASFGLRCLRANLGPLRPRSIILEFEANARAVDVVEHILAHSPRIVGLGVYIWNVARLTEVVQTLARVAPHVAIVLGGPEVSHETEEQPIVQAANWVVRGEGDALFAELCNAILAARAPAAKILDAQPPDLHRLVLPYDEYGDVDIAHRVVYVEASRGCPFTCEFCLSSLDERVRTFPLDDFLQAMQRLLDRGVSSFKFVDRTFNLGIATSTRILTFFLERWREGLFLHFEMIPDRLPEPLRAVLARFPAGAVQIEVGIQTFDDSVAARVSRRQDAARIADNLRFLRRATGVHVHADLIVGLPGEDLDTFARGFDRLLELEPHEIQVGMLKRLRGTPITRHDVEWGMVYATEPPYEVLQTASLDFPSTQRLRRFARYLDLVKNSGDFNCTVPLLWGALSPCHGFLRFSDWLHERIGIQHGIALHRLAGLLFEYLVQELDVRHDVAGRALWDDFQRTRPNDWPAFLRPYGSTARGSTTLPHAPGAARQARHAQLPTDGSR